MRQTGDYAAMQLPPVDPNLPVRQFPTFQDLVEKAASPRRFLILLLGGFAVFALLLASLGIYAMISYSVNQRVQEIGIRMALGASPGELQRGSILRTFGLAELGLALGVATSRALSNMLGACCSA
jgi:ABC-type antimicrobial peptide transport system permease subunit